MSRGRAQVCTGFAVLAGILAVVASGVTAAATENPAVEARVRPAVEAIWFHGVTPEIASREVGADGVPALLRWLHDPTFPRRDNVVAFLTHLGGPEATPHLLAFLQAPAPGVDLSIPEEDRAMLLGPPALGAIAARGDTAALDALLAMTAAGSDGGPLAGAVSRGAYRASMRDDLVERALVGLAIAGSPQALARLRSVADAGAPVVVGTRDLRPAAQQALARSETDPVGFDVVVSDPAPAPAVADPEPRSEEARLTYANHVDLNDPMSNARLDALLDDASRRAARADFGTDTACCIRVARSGNAKSFGTAGDGLDSVDNDTEMNTALNLSVARVKVVRDINWCGGAGTNIIGCAPVPGDSMVVVRFSNFGVETVLWLHEYGHNVGLSHHPDSRFIMASQASSSNNALTASECAAYHNPPFPADADNVDIGLCQDSDADDIASSADNCPLDFNPNQNDADGDGVGDVCEGGGGVDTDGDGIADAGDNCPDDANPTQADADLDSIGNACDPCTDADRDGFGIAGANDCPEGLTIDCNDNNAGQSPDGRESCDNLDNDCDGDSDELRCRELDVTSDDRVDGVELSWVGRAFGTCSANPSSEWWFDVDFSGDGCIDGDDLSLLAAGWGCLEDAPVCD